MALVWLIVALLLLGWFFGFVLNIAGGFIHVLLVLALAVIIVSYINSRTRPPAA